MKRQLIAVAAAALATCLASPAAPQVKQDLAGLWHARQWFEPDVRGTLLIVRSARGYAGELSGTRFDVREANGELSFALPGERGRFVGRLERGMIRGFWIRSATPVNGIQATPVRLRSAGRDRWSGVVDPVQDAFSFFLLLRPRADGGFDAVLRNPERDIGTQYGVRRLVRDGDALRLIAARGDGPERALGEGRYDAENDTFSLYIANRGGSYDFSRDDEASDFYPRGRNPASYAYRPPLERGDGWRTGTLEGADIDRPAIERLVRSIVATPMDSTDAAQLQALLVARHGRLVLEEYFHGFGPESLLNIRSAGKSVAAVTIGAAMRNGVPLSLSSPVYQVMNGGAFPAALDDPRKRAMTLEHLLTMSSGYFCDDGNPDAPGNENNLEDQTEQPDWYAFTLALPLATPPGENSVYCSISPNLALGMLARASGESPILTFDRLVAEPLGIDQYVWPLDPTGQAYGGGGVQLRSRDFLKFGQLMLDGGVWNGRRILDPAFVAAATRPQYHLANVTYGYLWWVEDFPYKERTVRTFSMRGNGGNVVTVVPELDLVIETMARNYASRIQLTYTGPLVPRSILPAVRERGDDPNAPVRDREFTPIYGRSPDGSRVVRSQQ
jgi:CubicO group peptidase (beta-lactamase class C family)